MKNSNKESVGNRHALEVSNYMLGKKDVVFTPMKLIKMIYIAHGWFMAFHDEDTPLINEPVEAWKYGPVISSVFHAFKVYERSPITKPAPGYGNGKSFGADEKDIIDTVVSSYGEFTGVALSDMTHREGTPWSKYFDRSVFSTVIPNAAICEHYRGKIGNHSKAST